MFEKPPDTVLDTVTAPVDAETLIPVPAVSNVTPPGAELAHAEPVLVKTLPAVPGDVIPVPPLATGNVPVTPVVRGNPVTLVITPDAGVPRAGAVNVLLLNVCVPVSVT